MTKTKEKEPPKNLQNAMILDPAIAETKVDPLQRQIRMHRMNPENEQIEVVEFIRVLDRITKNEDGKEEVMAYFAHRNFVSLLREMLGVHEKAVEVLLQQAYQRGYEDGQVNQKQ